MSSLQIKYVSPDELRPYAGNARTHSKKQIRQVADSIERFGFTNPIIVSEDNQVIAGHGRLAAAKLLGLTSLPVVILTNMTEADRRAYVIADNKLAELAGSRHLGDRIAIPSGGTVRGHRGNRILAR